MNKIQVNKIKTKNECIPIQRSVIFQFSCTQKLKFNAHELAYHGSCSDDAIG